MRRRPHGSERANAFIKTYLISKQLDRRKNLIRSLFRASGDRTVGERFLSKEPPVEGNDDEAMDEKTVFETVKATARPVLYPVQNIKFKWKKRQCRSDRHPHRKKTKRSRHNLKSHMSARDNQRRVFSCREGGNRSTVSSLSEAVMHPDFIIAYKIMVYVKQHNLLENYLNKEETEEVRQFFETELSRPTYRVSAKVMRLLHEAFNKCWDKIMDDCEKIGFTNEIGLFLSEREKAKACLLDVMLFFPEYIPEAWGGRHIVEISLPYPKPLTYAKSQYDAEDILTLSQIEKTREQNLSCRSINTVCTTKMSVRSIEPGWTENEMTRTRDGDERSRITRNGKSTLKGHHKSRKQQKKEQQRRSEMDSYGAQINVRETPGGCRPVMKKTNVLNNNEDLKNSALKSLKDNKNEDIEESKLRKRKEETEGFERKEDFKMTERNDTEMEISVHDDETEQRRLRSKGVFQLRSVRAEDDKGFSSVGNEGPEVIRTQKSKMKNEGLESNRDPNCKEKNEASNTNKRQKNKDD